MIKLHKGIVIFSFAFFSCATSKNLSPSVKEQDTLVEGEALEKIEDDNIEELVTDELLPFEEDSDSVETLEDNPFEEDNIIIENEEAYEVFTEASDNKDGDKDSKTTDKSSNESDSNKGETDSNEVLDGNDNVEEGVPIMGETPSSSFGEPVTKPQGLVIEEDPVEEEETTLPAEIGKIKPSRSMKIKRNQFIDVIYPGKGWVYQGCIDVDGNADVRNKNFMFGGKKLGGENQVFSLKSKMSGLFYLHFYKEDALTGTYIEDYLEVQVMDEMVYTSEHIQAPDYASIVPPKPKKLSKRKTRKTVTEDGTTVIEVGDDPIDIKPSLPEASSSSDKFVNPEKLVSSAQAKAQNAASNKVQDKLKAEDKEDKYSAQVVDKRADPVIPYKTVSKTLDQEISELSQDDLLNKAIKLYEEKKYEDAYKSVTSFLEKAVNKADEGLFLKGEILEEKSPVQNIKKAIEAYDTIVRNYPSSKLWERANKRSINLKRFYTNIR